MAWERESHHMNLVEGEHLIRLVDKSAVDHTGQPHRYLIQIRMGEGPFEHKVGHNTVRIKLGGDLTVDENGALTDISGNVFDPREFEKTMIARLNAHSNKLRAYAKKHGAPELKAQKT